MSSEPKLTLEQHLAGLFDKGITPLRPSEERHQLHWSIIDGSFVPTLTCLHRTLSYPQICTKDVIDENRDLFGPGFAGAFPEVRDGIIYSWWIGGHTTYYGDEDEADLQWDYVRAESPVTLQRHSVSYVYNKGSCTDEIAPVFQCLHAVDPAQEHPCDADLWREELYIFQEYHVGPRSQPLAPGVILSWWPTGEYSDDHYPFWGYESALNNQLIVAANAEHLAQNPK